MIGQSQEAEDPDWSFIFVLLQFLTVQYKKLKILSVQLNIVGQSKGTEAGSDWSLVNNKWCWILIG